MILSSKFVLNVIIPLIIGLTIYTLFRSETIILFTWYKSMGLNNIVTDLRTGLYEYSSYFPKWIIYSLPDGLWVYSFTSSMIIFWNSEERKLKLWLLIPFITGIIFEILQKLNLFPGTFDIVDLTISIIAFYSSIKFLKIKSI